MTRRGAALRASAIALLLLGRAGAGAGADAASPAGPDAVSEAAAGREWRAAALFGADVRSLVHDPRDADVVWAGTSGGQVYRSRDGGASWAAPGVATPFPGWVVANLLVDPDAPAEAGRVPARLWAGLWGVFGGGLVAYSEDEGRTWVTPHPVMPDRPVYALARVPGRPGWLLAGTRAGVLRSRDGGRHWERVGAELAALVQVESLWIDPEDPDRVVAGTWRRAYRSEDGGDSWQPVFTGMVEDTDIFSLHGVPGESGTVWASTCGWVYRSRDRGATWQRFQSGLAERRTPAFAAVSASELWAGTVAGVYHSGDGGETWTRRSAADLVVGALALDPRRPQRLLVGTEGAGVWRSLDGGRTFAPSSAGMHNVRVAALAEFGGVVWAAVNHAGPLSGVYRSLDGGRSFAPAPEPLPTVLALVATRDALWARTERGDFRRDDRGRWIEARADEPRPDLAPAPPAPSLPSAAWPPPEIARPPDLPAAETALAVLRLPGRWLVGTASAGLWLRETTSGAAVTTAGR